MKRTQYFVLPLTLLALLLSSCSSDPKERRQKFLEMGNKYFAKKEFKQAALSYRKALKEDPQFAEGYYRLGLASIETTNWSDAIGSLRRAFTLDPSNTDSGAKLAEIYMIATTQEPRKAKQFGLEIQDVSDKMLARDPKSFDGLRLAAFLDISQGKVDEAIKKYQTAATVKPNRPEVTIPLAQSLLNRGRLEDAEALALDQIKHNKKSPAFYDLLYSMYFRSKKPEECEKIIRLKIANTENPEFRLQLAAHYFLMRKPDEMEKVLKEMSELKDYPQNHIKVGDFYFSMRNLPKAKAEYETGLAKGKEKDLHVKRLAQIAVAEGKTDEAKKLVDQLIAEFPKDEDGAAMRAALQIQSNDLKQISAAIAGLQDLVKKNPKNYVTRYELARGFLSRSSKENKPELVEAARAELEETIKLRPDFPLAKVLLAQIQVSKQEFGKAIQTTEEILSSNPSYLEALILRSIAQTGLRDYDNARVTLEGLLANNPKLVDVRFHLGHLYVEQSKFKEAEAQFREMRKLAPLDARSVVGMLDTLNRQKRYKDAITFLREQIANNPKDQNLHTSLGMELAEDGQYEAAIAEFEALIKANPQSGELFVMLGDTYRRMGDLTKALECMEKAAAFTPNNPAALTRLALVLESLDRGVEAKKLYDKILTIDPNNFVALNNLAFLKADAAEDLDGALTMVQKAKQQQPNNDEINDTLGWIYLKKNLTDDSIRIFSDLVKRNPSNSIYRFHLAYAFYQKGDRLSARRELDGVMTSRPPKTIENKAKDLRTRLG